VIRGDLSAVNCDDCKAQILELIEREAIDPEAVRAVLAECPDCQAEFDETKALLALAGELPLEVPPARIDETILRAAAARNRAGASPERTPWRQPLAMAAVAMLAVGIGVSTISIGNRPSDEHAPTSDFEDRAAELEAPMNQTKAVGGRAMDEAASEVGAELAAVPPAEEVEKAAASPAARRAARRPARKKEAKQAAPEPRAELAQADLEEAEFGAADADGSRARAGAAASGAAIQKSDALEDDADTSAARRCARTVQSLEKRRRKDTEYEPNPEAQLEAGLCYRRLGKNDEARHWLRRAAEHSSTKARANEALGELE